MPPSPVAGYSNFGSARRDDNDRGDNSGGRDGDNNDGSSSERNGGGRSGSSGDGGFGRNGDSENGDSRSSTSTRRRSTQVITQQITVTATTVQTSVSVRIIPTTVVGNGISSTDVDDPSTPVVTSAMTSMLVPAPSPSPSPSSGLEVPDSAKSSNTSIPVASIVSIILSVLFFIALCLVLYFQKPAISSCITGRKKRHQRSTTIGSFEPKEYSPTNHPRHTFNSFVPFARHSDTVSEKSVTISSPTHTRVLVVANPSEMSYRLTTDVDSSRRSWISDIHSGIYNSKQESEIDQAKTQRSISVFSSEYPFENEEEAARFHRTLDNWRSTSVTTGSLPISVGLTSTDFRGSGERDIMDNAEQGLYSITQHVLS